MATNSWMRRWLGVSSVGLLLGGAAFGTPAVNDDFVNRTVLEGESITVRANFLNSTYQSAPLDPVFLGLEPPGWPELADKAIPSGSLWWEWTAPRSGGVVLTLVPTPGEALPHYTRAAFKLIAMSGTNYPQGRLLHPPLSGDADIGFWAERSFLSIPYSALAYQVVKGERYLIYGFGDARSSDPVSFRLEMPGRPVVLQDPSDVELTAGESGLLHVVAVGVPVPEALNHEHPLRYSWLRNAEPVLGASNSVLPLLSVSTSDAGEYRALVSDAEGSVTSSVARVSVVAVEEPPMLEILRGTASATGSERRPAWALVGATGRTYAIESSTNLVDWEWQPIEPLSEVRDEPVITRTLGFGSERPAHVRIRRQAFRFTISGGLKQRQFLRARRATPADPRRWVAWEALQLAKEDFGRDLRHPKAFTASPDAFDIFRRIPTSLYPELFDPPDASSCLRTLAIRSITSPPLLGCFPTDLVLWEPNYYFFGNPAGIWNPAR